jgi:hypothetical protein
MKMTHKIKLFSFFMLSLIILNACDNSKNKNGTQSAATLPQIDGFFIFKRDMSFSDIAKILDERKLRYRLLNLKNYDEINYPLSWRYLISASDLNNFRNVKIIEGFNLPILNKNLNKFQIGFFNDTIFYFNYEQNLEAKYIPNSEYKGNIKFTNQVLDDIALLKVVSEGLSHKYGSPFLYRGGLNAFYPSTSPFFQWDDNAHNGTQYIEWQSWLGRDSLTHIRLENSSLRDSSKLSPYEITVQGITTIQVLFNSKYAKEIDNFRLQKNELEEKANKKNTDSLTELKNKQFDSL